MSIAKPWQVNIITLFPDSFPGTLGLSLLGKALERDIWKLNICDLRAYGIGRHKTVDDTPYGGGCGMVIRPDVVDAALSGLPPDGCEVIYLSPRGEQFSQPLVRELVAKPGITLISGRYEGIDQRVLDKWKVREVRVGNAVLCGGEAAALVVAEACVRMLPGVVSTPESLEHETFACHNNAEHPQYTRPRSWDEFAVPDVLLSGNHAVIERWRRETSTTVKD